MNIALGTLVIMSTFTGNQQSIKKGKKTFWGKLKSLISPYTCLLLFFLLIFTAYCCLADEKLGKPKEKVLDETKAEDAAIAEPIIIWFHTADKDPNILRIALSGGIFTHVLFEGMHIDDVRSYRFNLKVREVLRICRSAKVKVIWGRWLWPGHNLTRFTGNEIFDADYYVRQISNIKKEARQMGADYTSLDLEPYGHHAVKGLTRRSLTESEFEMITGAIDTAVKVVGQVDYVMPAALPYPRHTRFRRELYKSLQKLGRFSIAEHTYYNNESGLHCKNNIFDVFGAYCRKDPYRPKYPTVPYFAPREILERQDLWAHKKGLFIYPGEQKDLWETAIEFSKIKSIRPNKGK